MKLLSLAPVLLLLQIAANPVQQVRPKAGLEGSVVRFGSGQPVAGARVSLTRSAGPSANTVQPAALPAGAIIPAGSRGNAQTIQPTTTDDKGKFVFQGLDEGSYTIQVQANGYVPATFGQRFPSGPGAPVTLTGDQTTRDIVVNLTPAANVSGRVRDTSDRPLVSVPVQLLRYSYDQNGQRSYQTAGLVQTNDRGEYRLYWITPGRYYLSAGQASSGSDPMLAMIALSMGRGSASGSPVTPILAFTFYPGVTDIGSARPIDLQPGADIQALDLTLTTKPQTFRIRGRLTDSRTGRPPARASISATSLTPGADASGIEGLVGSEEIPNRNYDGATGTFEIRDLLPGVYSVRAIVRDQPLRGAVGQAGQATAATVVSISNSDAEGLAMTVVPNATVSGRLRFESQPPASFTINRVRVQLVPFGGSPQSRLVNTQTSQTSADGTFFVNNVAPGDYRITLQGLPTGMGYLKEARFDGSDVLNGPLRFSGGSSGFLEVAVAFGGGRLSGVVTDARSQTAPNTRVVIVPDRFRDRADLYRTTNSDNSGRYTFAAVAPGDYKVFAWEDVEQFEWFDPDLLARSEARGRSVHISETSAETTDVRLIPGGTR